MYIYKIHENKCNIMQTFALPGIVNLDPSHFIMSVNNGNKFCYKAARQQKEESEVEDQKNPSIPRLGYHQ